MQSPEKTGFCPFSSHACRSLLASTSMTTRVRTNVAEKSLPEPDVHSFGPLRTTRGLWTFPCQGEFNSRIPALQVKAGELKGEPISDPGDAFKGTEDDLTREDIAALGTTLDLCNWKGISSAPAAPNKRNMLHVNKHAVKTWVCYWIAASTTLYCQEFLLTDIASTLQRITYQPEHRVFKSSFHLFSN